MSYFLPSQSDDPEERRLYAMCARDARYRLRDRLVSLLSISEENAGEVVGLIEELIENSADDLRDRMDARGAYDPDY